MQLDEIKCTLLHKISNFSFSRVVKQAQNGLFINAVCAVYFSVSSKYFACRIIFCMSRHFFFFFFFFSLKVCIKHGFTGTCQIFADIYKNRPQIGKVIDIYQVCTCI